jgi:hypothetical protein
MDMITLLTGNDDLILTPSYFRYHIREACCWLLLPSTSNESPPNQTLAAARHGQPLQRDDSLLPPNEAAGLGQPDERRQRAF